MYATSKVCQILGVSRSGYYRKKRTADSIEIETEKAVIHCFKNNKGNYGRVRIRKALLKKGIDVSEYKIARILRSNSLFAKSGRAKKRRAPKITEQQYIEENLLQNKFSVKVENYLWCSDITELACKRSKLYLCGILDVATRRLVGWALAKRQTQEIVQLSIEMAVGRNPKRPEGAIFHSDRGCQYTAKKTKDLLENYGFRRSMSRPGTPNDSQPIESFWKTLKLEMPDIRHLNYEDACRSIVSYIELYYNSQRLHSGIDYNIPNEFFTLLSVHQS